MHRRLVLTPSPHKAGRCAPSGSPPCAGPKTRRGAQMRRGGRGGRGHYGRHGAPPARASGHRRRLTIMMSRYQRPAITGRGPSPAGGRTLAPKTSDGSGVVRQRCVPLARVRRPIGRFRMCRQLAPNLNAKDRFACGDSDAGRNARLFNEANLLLR